MLLNKNMNFWFGVGRHLVTYPYYSYLKFKKLIYDPNFEKRILKKGVERPSKSPVTFGLNNNWLKKLIMSLKLIKKF